MTGAQGVEHQLERPAADAGAVIQAAVDALAATGGGTLRLAAGEWLLDRPVILADGIHLTGSGVETVLRKAPTRRYEVDGYHHYGQFDLPLRSTDGLRPGMGVLIDDDRRRGGFGATAARITWVEADRIGLDRPLEADYQADADPRLLTGFPLVCAYDCGRVAVSDMTLDGACNEDDVELNGCRGGALYFELVHDLRIRDVVQRAYAGEGLSFQRCSEVHVTSSSFDGNHGNGLHPGAGSTNVLFEGCSCSGNRRAGLFFCVRATRVTAVDCRFERNGVGISIGIRDCWNRLAGCRVVGNGGPGIHVRPGPPPPTEVHHCVIDDCVIEANNDAGPQISIEGDAHDLWFRRCRLNGGPAVRLGPAVDRISFQDCEGDAVPDGQSLPEPDMRAIGYQSDVPRDDPSYRHLSAAAL